MWKHSNFDRTTIGVQNTSLILLARKQQVESFAFFRIIKAELQERYNKVVLTWIIL